jgi:Spy/CpxP family protein refolding chaperone
MIARAAVMLGAAVMLAAAPLLAQAPGLFPWWESPIASDLGLSEEQQKQVRETVNASRDHLRELRRAVLSAESELRAEMDAGQVDNRKANDAIEKVVATRSELTRAVAQMSLKLRLVLTPAQWQELQRHAPRPPGFRRGGPGGPFGPGHHGGPEGQPPPRDRPSERF